MTLTSIETAPITVSQVHELVKGATQSWVKHKTDWAGQVVISRPLAITSLYNAIRASLSDTLPQAEIYRLLEALDVQLQGLTGYTSVQAVRKTAPSHGAVRPYGRVSFERWTQAEFFSKRRGSDGLGLIEELVSQSLTAIRNRVTPDPERY